MNANNVNDRLDQSSHGTPQVDPDQQRRYLGTFRERASLGIQIKDVKNPGAVAALKKDVQRFPNYTVLINSSIGDAVGTYMQVASQNNVKFDLKTGYSDQPDAYGVLYVSPSEAINVSPILWNHKYSNGTKSTSSKSSKPRSTKKSGFWAKLKSVFYK